MSTTIIMLKPQSKNFGVDYIGCHINSSSLFISCVVLTKQENKLKLPCFGGQ